jgi:hypothetical protein
MTAKKPNLKSEEIASPFMNELAERFPPILSTDQPAELIGKSVNTIYDWMAKGRLDGAYRKRGKHALFWRDRAVHILFDGKDWK